MNIHVLLQNVNVLDYGVLPQTLLGLTQIIQCMCCILKTEKFKILHTSGRRNFR